MKRAVAAGAFAVAIAQVLAGGGNPAQAAGGTITGSEALPGTGVSATAFKVGQGGPKCDAAFLANPLNGVDARVLNVGSMVGTLKTLNWHAAVPSGSVTLEFMGSDCQDKTDPANGLLTVSTQNKNVVFKVPAGAVFLVVHAVSTANATFTFA
jgi:hypothetical protein